MGVITYQVLHIDGRDETKYIIGGEGNDALVSSDSTVVLSPARGIRISYDGHDWSLDDEIIAAMKSIGYSLWDSGYGCGERNLNFEREA